MGNSRADYLLAENLSPASVADALANEFRLEPQQRQRVDSHFYDTFDGRLRAAGMTCVSRNGRLALLDPDGHELASAPAPTAPGSLLAVDLPPGVMRAALTPLVDVRALSPLAQVRSRVWTLAVLDAEGKTVARVILEQPSMVLGARAVRLCRRLRVAPVRGYDKAAARVTRLVEDQLGLPTAKRSLLDEAVIAAGGTPGGRSSKIEPELRADQRAEHATAVVLRELLEIMQVNLPGALADLDPEFLHDFRVAVRRTRAVQRELQGVFPPAPLARFRREFRWLQQATGPTRDLDVYGLEFDHLRDELPEAMRGDLDPLLAVLRKRRGEARRRMVRALRSERAQALLVVWAEHLSQLDGSTDALLTAEGRRVTRPDAGRPIAAVAGSRIAHVYGRMIRMGRAIDDTSPAEAYHELRKKGKELRYLLELFAAAGLYPGSTVRPMVKTLKGLQDTLGRHQDREVQVQLLRSLGDAVAARPGGAAGLMAMGLLVERLEQDKNAARAEFSERFGAFASKSQRKLVKETFR